MEGPDLDPSNWLSNGLTWTHPETDGIDFDEPAIVWPSARKERPDEDMVVCPYTPRARKGGIDDAASADPMAAARRSIGEWAELGR